MAGGSFSKVQAPVTIVHSNLDQEVIQVTEDRLWRVLKDHIEDAEQRKAWIAPLGTFIAIFTALVTADFRDFYFQAPTWKAVFLISCVVTLAWLLIAIRKAGAAPTIDDIVEKVKRRSAAGA